MGCGASSFAAKHPGWCTPPPPERRESAVESVHTPAPKPAPAPVPAPAPAPTPAAAPTPAQPAPAARPPSPVVVKAAEHTPVEPLYPECADIEAAVLAAAPDQKIDNDPSGTGYGKRLVVYHFNDAYNIEPVGGSPGAARLSAYVKAQKALNPLILFSGDAFSPSVMSTVTSGVQMPPVLNAIGVQASCLGNHDLDFGLEQCMKLIRDCKFPWMMANVKDKSTGRVLDGLHSTLMMEHNGIKVGLLGVVEREWLDTLGSVDPKTLDVEDFLDCGRRLARELRAQGAQVVIALTHMRVPNDKRITEQAPEIDLILGGHDHHYETDFHGPYGNLMCKSGTDFRDLTRIDVEVTDEVHPVAGLVKPKLKWERIHITMDMPTDPVVDQIVEEYGAEMAVKLEEPLGFTLSDLDARFKVIRSQESNIGNFLCDLVRKQAKSDIVLINSGTLRSDTIHRMGAFKMRDLVTLLPMPDSTVVLEVTGAQLLDILENGVSQKPKLEGRFPCVSGVKFKFDSSNPGGQRLLRDSVMIAQNKRPSEVEESFGVNTTIGNEDEIYAPLELDRKYTLATKEYLAGGKDGYTVMADCPMVVGEEAGLTLVGAIKAHFKQLDVLNMWDSKARVGKLALRWRSKTLSSKNLKSMDMEEEELNLDPDANLIPANRPEITCHYGNCVVGPDGYCIHPIVQDRIVDVNPDWVPIQ